MPHAPVGQLELAYETHGDPKNPALLMVMGLGSQLTFWPDELLEALASRGFYVITFDNRDIGLSSKLSGERVLPIPVYLGASMLGLRLRAAYRVHDMAADAVGLLDALNIERAHVVGVSMGGMIAQQMAIDFPDRLLSLTSWMSACAMPRFPLPHPRAILALISKPTSPSREDVINNGVETFRVIGSPAYPQTDEELFDWVARSYDRNTYPAGFIRQFAAILASENRAPKLRQLRLPAMVMHGDKDPLVPVAGGREVARLIPDCRLEIFAGVGHDIPVALSPTFANVIADHAGVC